MNKLFTYFENAYDELLHKVTWPTWPELQQTTTIVLTGIALLTVIIFAMDGAAEFLFSLIYKAL